MKLTEIGDAFRHLKLEVALSEIRLRKASALQDLENLVGLISTEQRHDIGKELYAFSKYLLQRNELATALHALRLAVQLDPKSHVFQSRLKTVHAASNTTLIERSMNLVSAQHQLGFSCVRTHCECQNAYQAAQCRELLGPDRRTSISGTQIYTLGPYYSRSNRGHWTQTLKSIKHQNRAELIPSIAIVAADYVRTQTELLGIIDVLIPVPPATDKFARRGFSVNDILCEHLERLLAVPVKRVLRREPGPSTRDATDSELAAQFTVENPKSIKALTALLVEDIWTWGRTIPICALKLREEGASEVYALALGKTEG